jgi:hypothetical protein
MTTPAVTDETALDRDPWEDPIADPAATGATSAGSDGEATRRWIAEAEAIGLDPRPTPITWGTVYDLARRTWKAERRYYPRLGRSRRLTSRRLQASILPAIRRPIFVVGAARSGTTFLGDCMGHLPEVSYHHEPPATKAAGRYVHERLWGYRRSRWFFRSVYAWLLRVELDGDLRFCDKTPTNALLLPFIDRAFPDSQIIHIVRDGRDAAASLLHQPWLRADTATTGKREPGGYLHGPWAPWWVERDRRDEFESTGDVHRMIWAWRRYTEAGIRDGRALPADRYLEIRYEDLARDPEPVGARILDFLGIQRPASRSAYLEALRRVTDTSMGSWKRVFTPEDLAVIEADSGALLRSLGYAE